MGVGVGVGEGVGVGVVVVGSASAEGVVSMGALVDAISFLIEDGVEGVASASSPVGMVFLRGSDASDASSGTSVWALLPILSKATLRSE